MTDLNLTIEEVFTEIVSGRMDTSDFEQWVYDQRADAASDGYEQGSEDVIREVYE